MKPISCNLNGGWCCIGLLKCVAVVAFLWHLTHVVVQFVYMPESPRTAELSMWGYKNPQLFPLLCQLAENNLNNNSAEQDKLASEHHTSVKRHSKREQRSLWKVTASNAWHFKRGESLASPLLLAWVFLCPCLASYVPARHQNP